MKNNKVWFDWPKRKEAFWFEQKGCESRDLQIECFGKDENVFKTWEKVYNVVYLVEVEDGDGRWISIEWNKPKFSLQDAVKEINKKRSDSAKKKNEKVKRHKTGKTKGELEAEIAQKEGRLKEIGETLTEYQNLTNQIEELNQQVVNLKKLITNEKSNDKQAQYKTDKADKEKQLKELRGKIKIREYTDAISEKVILDRVIGNLKKDLGRANDEQNGFIVDTGIPEEAVREMKFRVSVAVKGSRR